MGRKKKEESSNSQPKAKPSFTVFSWVKNIICDKKNWESFSEDEHSQFNTFLINKSLSNNPEYIELVNYIQTLPHTEKKQYHQIYCEMIPKNSRYFFPFTKKNKKEINEELLSILSSYFEIGFGETKDYIYILGKNGVEEILQQYGLEPKQIKTLIKEL